MAQAMQNPFDEPTPTTSPIVRAGGGRPAGYKTQDGKRCPGVTTITGRFKEAGGLVHWAWDLGIQGIDYRKVRDAAADAGHISHGWVDDTIHGRPLKAYPELTDAELSGPRNALDAFNEWREQVKLEIVATEVPLISEELRFGGTFDALFRVNGKLKLGDWKSGNRVYAEHLAQLGGYALLIEENRYLEQFGGEKLEGAQLLRFDKEFGAFAHFSWPTPVLDLGKSAFRQMRGLYDVCHRLGKAVG